MATISRMLMPTTVLVSLLFLMVSCQGVGYVEKSKYDKLQRDYIETKQKLEELQKNSEAVSTRFAVYTDSRGSVFRLNQLTGETCVLSWAYVRGKPKTYYRLDVDAPFCKDASNPHDVNPVVKR